VDHDLHCRKRQHDDGGGARFSNWLVITSQNGIAVRITDRMKPIA
jgi:hypothetical protein